MSLEDSFIKEFLSNNKFETLLLRPHRVKAPLNKNESKIGGEAPNLNGFDSYPLCKHCETPQNFTLQIYKAHFDEFYFPEDKVLFQVFRCPNGNCPDAFTEEHDLATFYFYFSEDEISVNRHYEKPKVLIDEYEDQLIECYFKPQKALDYITWGDEIAHMFENYGDDFMYDTFLMQFGSRSGTKINGMPCYIHGGYEVLCDCGNEKKMFFQISSEDVEDGVSYPPDPDNWSGHGLMIGDLGYIYFFFCEDCGMKSIEKTWECS